MQNLIDYIGGAVLALGIVSTLVTILFHGLWKPYFRKTILSQTEFMKVIRFIGVSALAAGFGMTILLLAGSQSGNWFTRIVSIMLCLVLYPVFQTGIFIFHMKREGFVRDAHPKNKE